MMPINIRIPILTNVHNNNTVYSSLLLKTIDFDWKEISSTVNIVTVTLYTYSDFRRRNAHQIFKKRLDFCFL